MSSIRPDHKIIIDLIQTSSKVLDLGCGDGELLSLLKKQKSCRGVGIEIDEKAIYQCMEKGVTVSHGDIDSGLEDYSSKCFDYVILNDSLQEILNPEKVIEAALRVGKHVIVGIPNFCNLSARLQIFFKGRVPVTSWLPYKWYNTPNLRFLSLKDFQQFCHDKKIKIEERRALTTKKEIARMTNLFAYMGIYLLSAKS
ncbi:Methionine biosynthesis protein MetW [hydrothermal vent metagenome]|uniref:Methionine biosynthesis protein MetW n=1 Tax=hydrothermal vent metagenome TaxID=652676 RepID=A0A3B1E192_9ZZZZ